MLDTDLRTMIDDVKDGRVDRRAFIQRMIAVGLTAPMATQILAIGGVAMAQSPTPYKPTKRGGGGALKVLWWQGPTLLNPHFAVGTKDQDGSRIFYEPLAELGPRRQSGRRCSPPRSPPIENGGLAKDGLSVTWKLKQGVKWHDGQPFSADDCIVQLAIRRGSRHRGDQRSASIRISTSSRSMTSRSASSSRSRRRSGRTPSSASTA